MRTLVIVGGLAGGALLLGGVVYLLTRPAKTAQPQARRPGASGPGGNPYGDAPAVTTTSAGPQAAPVSQDYPGGMATKTPDATAYPGGSPTAPPSSPTQTSATDAVAAKPAPGAGTDLEQGLLRGYGRLRILTKRGNMDTTQDASSLFGKLNFTTATPSPGATWGYHGPTYGPPPTADEWKAFDAQRVSLRAGAG